MIEKRRRDNRRCEPRHAHAGRVLWRKPGTYATFPGWLSDRSSSGVSFVAAARIRPASGDEIELIGADRTRQRFRVTRVASYDAQLSLIACCTASGRG